MLLLLLMLHYYYFYYFFSLSLLRKMKKAHKNISYSLCWIFKEQQRIFSLFIWIINIFSVLHTFFLFQKFFYCLRFSFLKLNFFCIAAQTFIIFTKSTLTGAAYFLYFISLLFYYFLYIFLCLDDGGCF